MNALNFILIFSFNVFLLLSYTESKFDFGSIDKRIVRITAPIELIVDSSSVYASQFDDLCIGTPKQCFPVILSIYDRHTQILDNTIASFGIVPGYKSTLSTSFFREKTLYTFVDTIFGRANYFEANETIRIEPSNNTRIGSDDVVYLHDFNFRFINKINNPPKFVSYGVLGLGHKSEFLYQLKNNSLIDKLIYSVELTDDRKSLEISIGDISPKLKEINFQNNITYCNIKNSDYYAMEYWGCYADMYLRTKSKKKYLLSQLVLFYEILGEKKEDVPVIYFSKMPSKYQEFLIDGMLDNNPKCGVNNTTVMIECDPDMDIKSLPNFLLVMNNITYVFKPEDLFYLNTSTKKLILKVKFTDDGSINHIKLSQHFLFSHNISMVYDMEKNQAGFYGFNTHKYRGDDDDGNRQNGGSDVIPVFYIILGLIALAGVGYAIYRCIIKKRINVPTGYVRHSDY